MRLPGFVDLQVNGFLGVDFSSADLTEEAFAEAARALLDRGVAAFCPTVITSAPEVYARNLAIIANAMEAPAFAGRLLGIHAEGPFISPEPGAVGAHPAECVRDPDPDFLDRMLAWARGRIVLLTLAPERPGAPELIRHARNRGLAVSCGHTLASAADLGAAADAGTCAITHLGNGLPNQLARHPNPLWDGLAEDRLAAMLIADGHHLPVSVLKVALRAKGLARTIAVSDASPIAGLPPGDYETLGNRVVLEATGKLWNPEKGCLVGSSATMLDCMNHLLRLGLVAPDEAVRIGLDNPLALLDRDAAELPGPARVGLSPQEGFYVLETP